MNTDDFRNALHADAAHQPPITPDLRAAVDRQVRRQRLRAIAVASPAVVVLLLGGVLLLPRGGQETTLSAADGGTGTTVVTSALPASTTSTSTATTEPSTTEPSTTEPAATVPSTTVPVPPPTTVAPTTVTTATGALTCGTVEIKTLDAKSLDTSQSGPFTCFMKAFNAGVQTDLTIVVSGADGGGLTERITATPDHLLTVTANGSMTVKLPAFNLGGGNGGGGLVPADPAGVSDCGTITIDMAATAPGKPDPKMLTCLMSAFTGSGSAHVTFVMRDRTGGTMTSSVDLSGTDHVLTVTMDGTTTIKLPDHLQVPDDVLKVMPHGSMGLNGIMGGMGGWGGFGADKHDK